MYALDQDLTVLNDVKAMCLGITACHTIPNQPVAKPNISFPQITKLKDESW